MDKSIIPIQNWTPAISSLKDLKNDPLPLVHATTVESLSSILHYNQNARMLMGEFKPRTTSGSSSNQNNTTPPLFNQLRFGVPSRIAKSSTAQYHQGYEQYGSVLLDILPTTFIREDLEIVGQEPGLLFQMTGQLSLPLIVSTTSRSRSDEKKETLSSTATIVGESHQKKSFASNSTLWCTTLSGLPSSSGTNDDSYHIQPEIIIRSSTSSIDNNSNNNNDEHEKEPTTGVTEVQKSIFLRIEKIRFVRHLAKFDFRNCQFGTMCFKTDHLRQEMIRRFWNEEKFNNTDEEDAENVGDNDEEQQTDSFSSRATISDDIPTANRDYTCSDCSQISKFLLQQGGRPSLILQFRRKFKDQWQKKLMLLMYAFCLQNLFALQHVLAQLGIEKHHLALFFRNEFSLPESATKAFDGLPLMMTNPNNNNNNSNNNTNNTASLGDEEIKKLTAEILSSINKQLEEKLQADLPSSSQNNNNNNNNSSSCCACSSSFSSFTPIEDPFLTFAIFTSSSSQFSLLGHQVDVKLRNQFLLKGLGYDFTDKFVDIEWKSPLYQVADVKHHQHHHQSNSNSKNKTTVDHHQEKKILFSSSASSPFVFDRQSYLDEDKSSSKRRQKITAAVNNLHEKSFSPSINPMSRIVAVIDEAHLGSGECNYYVDIDDDDDHEASSSGEETSVSPLYITDATKLDKKKASALQARVVNALLEPTTKESGSNKNLIIVRLSSTPLPPSQSSLASSSNNKVFYFNPPRSYIGWDVFRSDRIVVDLESCDSIRFPRAPVKTTDRLFIQRRYRSDFFEAHDHEMNNGDDDEAATSPSKKKKNSNHNNSEIYPLNCNYKPLTFADATFEKPNLAVDSSDMKNTIIALKLELSNKLEELFYKHHPEEKEKKERNEQRVKDRLSATMIMRRGSSRNLLMRNNSSTKSSLPEDNINQKDKNEDDEHDVVKVPLLLVKSPEIRSTVTQRESSSVVVGGEESATSLSSPFHLFSSPPSPIAHHRRSISMGAHSSINDDNTMIASPQQKKHSSFLLSSSSSSSPPQRATSSPSSASFRHHNQLLTTFTSSHPEALQLRKKYQNIPQLARNQLLEAAQEKYFQKFLKQYREALKIFLDDPNTRARNNIVQLIKTLRYTIGEKVDKKTGQTVVQMSPPSVGNKNSLTSKILAQQQKQKEIEIELQENEDLVKSYLMAKENDDINTKNSENNNNDKNEARKDDDASANAFLLGLNVAPDMKSKTKNSDKILGFGAGGAARSISEANMIRDSGKWQRSGLIRFQSSVASHAKTLHQAAIFVNALNITYTNKMNTNNSTSTATHNKTSSSQQQQPQHNLHPSSTTSSKKKTRRFCAVLLVNPSEVEPLREKYSDHLFVTSDVKTAFGLPSPISSSSTSSSNNNKQLQQRKIFPFIVVVDRLNSGETLPSFRVAFSDVRLCYPECDSYFEMLAVKYNRDMKKELRRQLEQELEDAMMINPHNNNIGNNAVDAEANNSEEASGGGVLQQNTNGLFLSKSATSDHFANLMFSASTTSINNHYHGYIDETSASSPSRSFDGNSTTMFGHQKSQQQIHMTSALVKMYLEIGRVFGYEEGQADSDELKDEYSSNVTVTAPRPVLVCRKETLRFDPWSANDNFTDVVATTNNNGNNSSSSATKQQQSSSDENQQQQTLRKQQQQELSNMIKSSSSSSPQPKLTLASFDYDVEEKRKQIQREEQQQAKKKMTFSSMNKNTNYGKSNNTNSIKSPNGKNSALLEEYPTLLKNRQNLFSALIHENDFFLNMEERRLMSQLEKVEEEHYNNSNNNNPPLVAGDADENLNPTIVTICAPPQSGKTEIIFDLLRQIMVMNNNKNTNIDVRHHQSSSSSSSSVISSPLPLARPSSSLQTEMKQVFEEFVALVNGNKNSNNTISKQLGRMNYKPAENFGQGVSNLKARELFSPPRSLLLLTSTRTEEENTRNTDDDEQQQQSFLPLEETVEEIQSSAWKSLPPLERYLLDKLEISDFSDSHQAMTSTLLQVLVLITTTTKANVVNSSSITSSSAHEPQIFDRLSFLMKNLQEQGFFQASTRLKQESSSESFFVLFPSSSSSSSVKTAQQQSLLSSSSSSSYLTNSPVNCVYRLLETLHEYFVLRQNNNNNNNNSSNSNHQKPNAYISFTHRYASAVSGLSSSSSSTVNIFPSLAVLACVLVNDLIKLLEEEKEETKAQLISISGDDGTTNSLLLMRSKVVRLATLGLISNWTVQLPDEPHSTSSTEEEDMTEVYRGSSYDNNDIMNSEEEKEDRILLFRNSEIWEQPSSQDIIQDLCDVVHQEEEEDQGNVVVETNPFRDLLFSMFQSRIVHLCCQDEEE